MPTNQRKHLSGAIDWAKQRTPVRVCRACGVPAVGFKQKGLKQCPACGIEKVNDPTSGSVYGTVWPWGAVRDWVHNGTLVVVDEIEEK